MIVWGEDREIAREKSIHALKEYIVQGIKKRTDLDHDDAELVDLAIKECHRMRDLIKSLQDFNRPTSARKAPMDIHAALRASSC